MKKRVVQNRPSIDLTHPQVMGIINVTPNSFSGVGRFMSPEGALSHAKRLVEEGAAIIDVGAEPTNPGVHPVVSLQEELDRLLPVLELLLEELDIPISVDTSKAEVMEEVIRLGVHLINDVRAFQDERALAVVAKAQVLVCIMHMAYPLGKPPVNQSVFCDDIVVLVKQFLENRLQTCMDAGINAERIIIDPGIGHGSYGKNTEQNLTLLKRLDELKAMGFPVLVGVSRKTFIGEILNLQVDERLSGSLAATAVAIMNGASIIRAHDVKETVEVIKVIEAIRMAKSNRKCTIQTKAVAHT